jgi:asparagine synthase (glutamine-hydrolysing)
VDSSALLDIAHRQNGGEQLKCFTIGFAGESFEDERHYARLVAERLGLTHFQTTISREEFFETLPTFLWHLEEPICEPPAIALYFVSKLAREHVKVVISGEGGDEAFAGYPNYRNNMLFEWAKSVLGRSGSRLMSRLLSGVKDRRVAKYARHFQMPLESYYFSRTSSPCAMLAGMRGELLRTADAETGAAEAAEDVIARHFAKMNGAHILDKMLYVDTVTWLPDDLLLKADKITMAHSLELRVPLLDHMVMQFAASLPPRDKVRGMATKYILKKAFEGRVPTEVLRRRKSGFPVPYERWMQEKKSMIWEVLLDGRTLKRGFFNAPILTDKVYRRLKGNERMPKELFSLFILELWARLFLDGSTVTLN